jgi:hypothetical protein
MSVPPGTEMFQFPRFASPTYVFSERSPSNGGVSPFGHPRINERSPLPAAFRSVPRPSSPLGAKASTERPSHTRHPTTHHPHAVPNRATSNMQQNNKQHQTTQHTHFQIHSLNEQCRQPSPSGERPPGRASWKPPRARARNAPSSIGRGEWSPPTGRPE